MAPSVNVGKVPTKRYTAVAPAVEETAITTNHHTNPPVTQTPPETRQTSPSWLLVPR